MKLGPLANGANGDGRDNRGRFQRGNRAAKGRAHPHAAHVAELRGALLRKIGPDELGSVVDALLAAARTGDVSAARELLRWALGEPLAADLLERLERLETASSEGKP